MKNLNNIKKKSIILILLFPTIIISLIIYGIWFVEEQNNTLLFQIENNKRMKNIQYWQELLTFKELDMDKKILNQTYYSDIETFWTKKMIITLLGGISLIAGGILLYKYQLADNYMMPTIDSKENRWSCVEKLLCKQYEITEHAIFARGRIVNVLIQITEYHNDVELVKKLTCRVPTCCFNDFENNFASSIQKLFFRKELMNISLSDALRISDNNQTYKVYVDLWKDVVKR